MPNIYWFIILSVIGLGISIYVIYTKRYVYKVSTLLVFFLFSASITWIGEFIVLGLFDSYAYKTGIFSDPWAQNLLGHLMLNTTLYPAIAIIIAAYSLKNRWIFFIAILFNFIEVLCVKFDLYEHHWWTYYMTFLGVVIYLLFTKKWFSAMIKKPYGPVRCITFYFAAMLMIHTPAPVLLLLHKQHYRQDLINNLVDNFYLSSIIIIFSYHLIEAFILVMFTCVLKKWYWNVVPFIVSLASQIIFARLGILIMEDSWKLSYTLILYEISIAAFVFLEKYSLKQSLMKKHGNH